ncbi:MAG TPA: AMP-binding protein, partial [Rubricoccaceae bacterium]
LWHVGGLGVVVRCALAGAAMAIPEPGTSTAEALRRFAPTHASLVSTQLFRLLRDDPAAGIRLRAILLGGSAIAPALLDAAHAAGLPVCAGYGMTETASTVTMTAPGEPRNALGTAGHVLPGREVRISGSGEIEVRGATLFAGYLGADGPSRPLTPDGWFATGDAGHVDASGRLVVTGRLGTRFVSGGENVQPEAIEATLAAVPGIAEAVVVPVADPEWGARPVAFVRPSGAVLPDAVLLRAALRETLPGYAVPVAFHAWAGAAGLKPDRRALAAEAARLAGNAGA